ncbi:helix-turn-helix transcriptional regulator [Massilimicrobiota sp. An134]|uniref:helix-turn-helix domain-containing protein n=1 Tax=Massilimicrobiota sp. An134 TaxID=1965557 RepID=UPI000B37FF9A|nr:helix-turn-helix transcriptional regulator [Massilimicrobiota sp. An134]OUQ25940.1 hypothetical protein B5E79_11635 [Massilimicrobiota sp. An134]
MKNTVKMLKHLREMHNLKQKDIANILGITQQTYSTYENGINDIPLHHLLKLADYYNVSLDFITCHNINSNNSFLDLFLSLHKDNQKFIIDFLKFLKSRESKL